MEQADEATGITSAGTSNIGPAPMKPPDPASTSHHESRERDPQLEFPAHNDTAAMQDLKSIKKKREQVESACASCRRSKKKCDGTMPCSRCLARNVSCTFDRTPSSGGTDDAPTLCGTAPHRTAAGSSAHGPVHPHSAPPRGRMGFFALLPFCELGWRPADVAWWIEGLTPVLRANLERAFAVLQLDVQRRAMQIPPHRDQASAPSPYMS